MPLSEAFLWFVALGAIAQLIDGALGMAYGLLCSTVLLTLGYPPATVSAVVHTAEVVTTGVSGGAHAVFGNVDRGLFFRLAVPGALGGVAGALFLVNVAAEWIKPLIVVYLMALGVLILLRAVGRWRYRAPPSQVPPLGLVAGTLDAIGGGGWGSVTTSSLLAGGRPARQTIGTVAAAEFVVTVAIAVTFASTIGFKHLEIVLGLLIGGALAAPFAALVVRRFPERVLLWLVGGLVLVLASVQAVRLLS
ncbi:MAG TPA: hypothetical protein DCM32_08800 [Xanthomonadaceae bacterium]|jgi:uncharacterized membrane protein YfcA|nr:hypothetical protein [Xanthomonadaceae bacterium]